MRILILSSLLILCNCVDDNIVRFTTKKTLTTTADSSMGWNMENIFQDTEFYKKKINTYFIEGNSPCITQDPSLYMSDISRYMSAYEIVDFAIAGNYLYYLTEHELSRLTISTFLAGVIDTTAKIYSFQDEKFNYLDVFTLPNGSILLILKSDEPYFYYIVLPKGTVSGQPMNKLDHAFNNFTLDMKLAFYDRYLFIPALNKGLFVYEYVQSQAKLKYKKTLIYASDVHDIAIKFYENINKLLVITADYGQGIVTMFLRMDTVDIDDLKLLKEFYNAKSVSIVTQENSDRLVIILDGLKDSTQLYVLNLFLSEQVGFIYEDVKLLDGKSQYGDVNSQYASILMLNSILITEIHRGEYNMHKYIDSEGIAHAKLYDSQGVLGVLIFYVENVQIIAKRVLTNTGFLLCDTEIGETEPYNFLVSGLSTVCGADENGFYINECLYQVNVTLEVNGKSYIEIYNDTKNFGIILGISIAILILLLIIALILIILCYKKTTRDILLEEEKKRRFGGANLPVINSNPSPRENVPESKQEEKQEEKQEDVYQIGDDQP